MYCCRAAALIVYCTMVSLFSITSVRCENCRSSGGAVRSRPVAADGIMKAVRGAKTTYGWAARPGGAGLMRGPAGVGEMLRLRRRARGDGRRSEKREKKR